MSVEGLTLAQVEDQIAENLLGIGYVNSVMTSNGSTTTIVDTQLTGGTSSAKGKWVLFDSGSNDGLERQISADDGAGTLTFVTAVTSTQTGDTYKMFSNRYRSTTIRRAVNRAISMVLRRFYVERESLALHGDGVTVRFDLPTTFQLVDGIEYRRQVNGVVVHDCDSLFDETTDANFTQALDSEVRKSGQSLKLTVAAAASLGDFVTDSIPSVDLSKYTHLEGWFRSSVALDAADYVIHLNDTAVLADGNDQESLNMPAASADRWTFFHVALAAPENDTAIASFGLEMDVDKAAHTIWFDQIVAVNHDSGEWTRIPKQSWSIDQEANDLVFTDPPTYRLLKISGGSHPSQMTAGTDVATVSEGYLVAKATSLLLIAGSRASREDPEGYRSLGRDWEITAIREAGKFPVLTDARKLA